MTRAPTLGDSPARRSSQTWPDKLRSAGPAILVTIGVLVLLATFVAADPAPGFTFSTSPWTDEAWNALGARNAVLLGRWSTDQWNLYLVELPFSLLLAGVFKLFGVGIVQARLLCIGFSAATVLAIGLSLRRAVGVVPATVAALGVAASPLVLYYGRLVYLETLVLLGMALALATLIRSDTHPMRWGLAGGLGLAMSVGTKASALLPVAGLLAGVALYGWLGERRFLRWSVGALIALIVAALGWVVIVYLPNRAMIADDLLILAPITFPQSPTALLKQLISVPRADGILRLTWPLVLLGGSGGLLALVSAQGRAGTRGALLFGALGWLVVGGGAIAMLSYRPNRYFLPVIPALAILAAIGLSVVLPWLGSRSRAWLRVTLATALALALAVPGLLAYRSWMQDATSNLPAMQSRARELIPPGSTAFGGLAPALLMTAPVVTIARTVGVQAGADLYATRTVRWFVAVPGADVEPLDRLHPEAWAARVAVYCGRWGAQSACLYHVP